MGMLVKKGTQQKRVQYFLQDWKEKHKGWRVYCFRAWLEQFFNALFRISMLTWLSVSHN